MLYAIKPSVKKFARFIDLQLASISDHRSSGGILYFKYTIPIEIDRSIISSLDGDLQVKCFSSQRSRPRIVVKRSEVASTNFFKKIDLQRFDQISSRKYGKKYFATRFIDRPDLVNQRINFEIEVSSSDVVDTFTVEIVNLRTDGSSDVVDTAEIDHETCLKQYDIPSVDFLLTATRLNDRKIYVAASSSDKNVGSFKFFLKKETQSDFLSTKFLSQVKSPVDQGGTSTAIFEVSDSEQVYTVLARPISSILSQEVGNFRQNTIGYVQSVKQLPFYLDSIQSKNLNFRVTGMNSSIKKVFLYKQKLSEYEREYITYSDNSGGSITLVDESRNPQYDHIYTVDYLNNQNEPMTSPSFVVVPALKLDSLARISASLVSSEFSQEKSKTLLSSRYLSFNVKVAYNTETVYDQLVTDLKSLGLDSLVSSDLEKTTNNLKPIIRVIVSRISLNTGEETDLGIFSPGTIQIPVSTSSKYGSNEPFIYRFEVAVRSFPEALEGLTSGQRVIADNSFNIGSINDLGSKLLGNRSKSSQSNFSAKFFSRSSIRGSELRYGDNSNIGDLGFYAGRTGIFSDVRVNPENITSISIKNLKFSTRTKGSYISWSVSGLSSEIDFFEVSVDGSLFYSHPTSASVQIFNLGNIIPRSIRVSIVSRGTRQETGASTLQVNA